MILDSLLAPHSSVNVQSLKVRRIVHDTGIYITQQRECFSSEHEAVSIFNYFTLFSLIDKKKQTSKKEDAYRYEDFISIQSFFTILSPFWKYSLFMWSHDRRSSRSVDATTRTDLNALCGYIIAYVIVNYWTFFFISISVRALWCRLIAYYSTKKKINFENALNHKRATTSRAEKFQKQRILHPINNWLNVFKNKFVSSGTFLRPFFEHLH